MDDYANELSGIELTTIRMETHTAEPRTSLKETHSVITDSDLSFSSATTNRKS